MHRFSDPARSADGSRKRRQRYCLPPVVRASAPRSDLSFQGSIASLRVPLSTLRRRPHDRQRMTRGHRGSLVLRCRALSSPSPCRFIPAPPQPHQAPPPPTRHHRGLKHAPRRPNPPKPAAGPEPPTPAATVTRQPRDIAEARCRHPRARTPASQTTLLLRPAESVGGANHGSGRVGERRPVSRGRGRLSPGLLPPPIDPCMRFSRTRLADVLHRPHSACPAPQPGGTRRDDNPVEVDQAKTVR